MPELTNIKNMAHVPEQYVEAHGCTLSSKYKKRYTQGTSKGGDANQKQSGLGTVRFFTICQTLTLKNRPFSVFEYILYFCFIIYALQTFTFVSKSVTMTFLYDKVEEADFRNLKAEFAFGKQQSIGVVHATWVFI